MKPVRGKKSIYFCQNCVWFFAKYVCVFIAINAVHFDILKNIKFLLTFIMHMLTAIRLEIICTTVWSQDSQEKLYLSKRKVCQIFTPLFSHAD